jgi:hypothetical protein
MNLAPIAPRAPGELTACEDGSTCAGTSPHRALPGLPASGNATQPVPLREASTSFQVSADDDATYIVLGPSGKRRGAQCVGAAVIGEHRMHQAIGPRCLRRTTPRRRRIQWVHPAPFDSTAVTTSVAIASIAARGTSSTVSREGAGTKERLLPKRFRRLPVAQMPGSAIRRSGRRGTSAPRVAESQGRLGA